MILQNFTTFGSREFSARKNPTIFNIFCFSFRNNKICNFARTTSNSVRSSFKNALECGKHLVQCIEFVKRWKKCTSRYAMQRTSAATANRYNFAAIAMLKCTPFCFHFKFIMIKVQASSLMNVHVFLSIFLFCLLQNASLVITLRLSFFARQGLFQRGQHGLANEKRKRLIVNCIARSRTKMSCSYAKCSEWRVRTLCVWDMTACVCHKFSHNGNYCNRHRRHTLRRCLITFA